MTTVSIAMCTYNGAAFLKQQLDSLANQTFKPNEIIICDDASSDSTIAIINYFKNNSDLPVRIHQNPRNLGYIKNFEKAISLCTKDLIFLCDQDDLWHPEKIQKIVTTFESEPKTGIILHNFKKIDENNHPFHCHTEKYGVHQIESDQLSQHFEKNSIDVFMTPYPRAWCGCMMAYRRIYNDLILPIFPGKGHDDWILKLLAPITDTRFINEPLISYRMHQKNTNRRDLKTRTPIYLFNRSLHKLSLALKGYTKSNFYNEIISRIEKSKQEIKHPRLIKEYRKYT